MPSAAADEPIAQPVSERLKVDRVQPDQRHVAERRRQLARVVELLIRRGGHGGAGVEQQAHRHARLDLEHLQEQLLQAHVGAPVDRAQIVAVMEVAMIEKLLPGAGEARGVVAAHQARRTISASGW